MKKMLLSLVLLGFMMVLKAQVVMPKFGKGIQVTSQDSSFYLKLGFRFQTLYTNQWELFNDEFSSLENYESALFIRRSRLKFDGWALNKRFKYKAELALSNRDNGGGNSSEFSNAANIILDAWIDYNFYKGAWIRVGQMKLPGNRERVISSGNMQFVDRSRLNSRYTLDRDVGIMIHNEHKLGDKFVLREKFAWSSGEGKNITSGNLGGHGYSFRVEALPFGKFKSKGDYIGSAIKYEEDLKLSVAVTYDINVDAGRTRGQKGSFIDDFEGEDVRKTLYSYFADLMLKYRKVSVMGEYAYRKTADDDARIITSGGEVLGEYYMGSGLSWNLGYMIADGWEIAGRWTDIKPAEFVANDETQYTLGASRYFRGHKLKIQSDLTYRAITDSNDDLFYRMQMDFHF